MAKNKSIYYFTIEKKEEKSSAWLVTVSIKEPDQPNNGEIKRASAWSSASPAKRWCASMVGRKSLRWAVSEDKKRLTASLEVKSE